MKERNLPTTSKRPYLLLDAGGTLVWPNPVILRRAGETQGCNLEDEAIFRAYYQSIHRLDIALRRGADAMAINFFSSLLIDAGTPVDLTSAVMAEVERICARNDGAPWARTLWTCALPGARAAIEQLYEAGYRMSVVSNSDGSIAQQISDLGVSRYFDAVFDSHLLGVEKPDRRIFEQVLERLTLTPNECLFVGDVFMIDLVGANAAGIPAIHLDPLGLYKEWPGFHTRDLQSFASALTSGELDPLPRACLDRLSG